MKLCSFCGQEIPRDSLTCRFCSHPQAAARSGRASQKISYSHRGSLAVLAAVAAVSMLITNRESEPLSGCEITLTEGSRSNAWSAAIPKLAPAESATVTWSEFRNTGGSEMPVDVGMKARYATVKCESHKDTRKGAAIAFRGLRSP